MNIKEIVIMCICLALIPIGLAFWINNAKASDTTIKDMTLYEYVNEHNSSDIEIDNSFFMSGGETLNKDMATQSIEEEITEDFVEVEQDNKTVKVTMNFTGDCTLGSDSNYGYKNTFFDVYDRQSGDYAYFFSNMQRLFANDDVTVVNLEGTFTNYLVKTPKKYNFRAPPEYANIILSGDIQAVNLANNHTKDYGQIGYDDTIKTLEEYSIPYFGYDNYYIYEKDGVKIGFAGLTSIWDGTIENRIDKAINYFNENGCNAKIFTFHWGIERAYEQNSTQRRVAHYAIDKGADLIVGHHPHVLQGIEEYNGKYIVYSLANFCFGGNTNPPDKDTMVFNMVFEFEDGKLVSDVATIYPARVSSVNNKNDFKPTLAEGEDFTRILNKILKYGNVKADENGVIVHEERPAV